MWDYNSKIRFTKTGAAAKKSMAKRIKDLESRLKKRLATLDDFMADKKRLRCYLIRDKEFDPMLSSQPRQEFSSEEHQEISELCSRICRMEKELTQLKLSHAHLNDKAVLKLSFDELKYCGFEVE